VRPWSWLQASHRICFRLTLQTLKLKKKFTNFRIVSFKKGVEVCTPNWNIHIFQRPQWTSCSFNADTALIGSRGSSVSIVTRLRNGPIPGRGNGEILSPCHRFQTDSGAHPASYQMGTRGKAARAWSWPLTPCRAEVRNAWTYTSTSSSSSS
jgi:hypothetical protein